MGKRKHTVYRDTKTGRFVSKATWKRSHARGGIRYRRTKVSIKVPGRRKAPKVPKRPPVSKRIPSKVSDWLIIWHYEGQPARDIGFLAAARSEDEALEAINDFMAQDEFARHIVASGFANWTIARVQKKGPSKNPEGHVEYREQKGRRG